MHITIRVYILQVQSASVFFFGLLCHLPPSFVTQYGGTRKEQEDSRCKCNVKLGRVRVTVVAAEKQYALYILIFCSISWVIRPAKRMRHIILPYMACLAAPYFSTLSHKRNDFRRKVFERKMFVVTFSANFVWNIFRSVNNAARCYHKCI